MRKALQVVEAGYQVRSSLAEWLKGVALASRPFLDEGEGVFACLVDATDPRTVQFTDPIQLGCPPEIWELAKQSATKLTPEEQAANLRRPYTYATVSERLGPGGTFKKHWMYGGYRDCGLSDFALLTSTDLDGHGIVLGAPRKKLDSTTARERGRWTLIAAHLRAAARLQRAAASGRSLQAPEAVLTPDGKPRHLSSIAQAPEMRVVLRDAVMQLERIRSSEHGTTADALSIWQALIGGRWSILDQFDADGKRFLIARPNEPEPPPIRELTNRECQVVSYARLGHSNKLISYELGLSPARVSEATASAMLKLGIRDRRDLLSTPVPMECDRGVSPSDR